MCTAVMAWQATRMKVNTVINSRTINTHNANSSLLHNPCRPRPDQLRAPLLVAPPQHVHKLNHTAAVWAVGYILRGNPHSTALHGVARLALVLVVQLDLKTRLLRQLTFEGPV